jgi:uncharacterized protein
MLKYLLVIGVIAIIYFIFIKKKTVLGHSKQESGNDTANNKVQSNDMVQCSTCKIYCELGDALLSNNKYYCSKECLERT